MMVALRLARRELRGGVRGLRIVLACLALGVAVIAAVGTMRAAIDQGLATDGRRVLGGDLEIESGSQPLPDALRAWLAARGARVSGIVQMRSMLVAEPGERELVELKAVDDAWPMIGAAVLDPPAPARAWTTGIVADPIVLQRLGVAPGATVRLGASHLVLRAAITAEPDRVASASLLGPRALIGMDELAATGLVAPGSIVEYALRVVLPPGWTPESMTAAVRAAFPDQGWRIRDAAHAAPGVTRFIEQTGLFMTLVGLTSLLVGGIGVSNGVRAWLEARAGTIATLRCLGASGRTVFAVCLIQVAALSAAGLAAGLILGATLPIAGLWLLRDVLPVPPRLGLYPGPLLLAAAYGTLTATAFALPPLGRAARIPGGALFRDALLPAETRAGPGVLAASAAMVAALVALTVATSPDRSFALWFCGAAILTVGLFRAGGAGLVRAARAVPRLSAPWARLGIANLHRPGAATPVMLVSVGLGLSTLAAVALIQGNIRAAVLDQLPARAPSFYFIDIQNDQLGAFHRIVDGWPGQSGEASVPSLRARVVALKGVPVDRVEVSPETRWALRGDRGLTYAATVPEGSRVVAGTWWAPDYDGPLLVSLDAGLARGWGVGIGDAIRLNVLGRDLDFTVANLRDIAWRSLSINFTMVASPGLLSGAPHMNIATVRVPPDSEGRLLRAVTDALPNVTGIRVGDVLQAVAGLLDQIAAALAATGSVTLVAGGLVLAGAVASGQRRRVREAVILKTLGATRGQVLAAWMVEFGALGLAAGALAAAVGTAASWGVMRFVMHADWVFLPATLAATIIACIALMLVLGYATTWSALRAKAAPLLRTD
jgi:putative ABC transport system permease protein